MPHDHRHQWGPQKETGEELSPQDKLRKMVEYWIRHNEEHARSYRDWANRARDLGLEEAGLILEQLADKAVLSNQDLEKIQILLKPLPLR